MRKATTLSLLGLLLAALLLPAAGQAQARERCFEQTGHCISGAILAYWERNGGLPIFGYPISPVMQDSVFEPESGRLIWTGPLQWFERDRLEDHSNEGLGVLAGRLGAEQLNGLTVGLIVDRPAPIDDAPPGCRFFPETRQAMCGEFRAYWERNGGLERFGYPISGQFELTSGAWSGTVQYFERRRMELHDELPGRPVLLGLLGREIRTGEPSASCPVAPVEPLRRWVTTVPFNAQLGCPTEAREAAAAEQYFQHGVMVWVAPAPGEAAGRIYVVSTRLPVKYGVYADTYVEGQPEPRETAPPGLFVPQRGFGKLWREIPGFRDELGWGVEPERANRAVLQQYTRGAVLWLVDTDFAFAFGPNQIAQGKPRSWGG